jgi:hypothetical protein
MSTTHKPVFPEIPRPQYVVNPEVLQSALAWRLVGDSTDGFIFSRKATGTSLVTWVRTNPFALEDDVERESAENRWFSSLEELGLTIDRPGNPKRDVANSIISAIEGIRQPGAKGGTAIPITFQAALLQNYRGVLGVQSPPNLGLILDVLHGLGGTGDAPCATSSWHQAVKNFGDNSILARLDRAMEQGLAPYPEDVTGDIQAIELGKVPRAPGWLEKARKSSPFHWFRRTWDNLMQESWREALPPRKWCDWATCVLRTAIGACYLWEAHFYQELAKGLLHPSMKPSLIFRNAVAESMPLLAWHQGGTVGSSDIATKMKSTVLLGLNAKKFIEEEIINGEELGLQEIDEEGPGGLEAWISRCQDVIREKPKTRRKMSDELRSPRRGAHDNLYEAIRYALLCRQPLGENADLYALLAKRGSRYTIVEPSAEWPVVIASLACPGPSQSTRLGEVMDNLRQLGLRPSYNTLIETLEAVGLCQSSHDADEAIEVYPAF